MDHHLQVLKQQYLQLVDPAALSFPPLALLHTQPYQSALFTCLFSPDSCPSPAPPPPPERYTARVLKRLISHLSSNPNDTAPCQKEEVPNPPLKRQKQDQHHHQEEIDERILSLYTQLISSPPSGSVVEKQHVTYSLPLSPFSQRPIGQAVTLLECPAVISGGGTTGMRTWEAAMALAEYLICSHFGRIYNVSSNMAPAAVVKGERLVGETGSVLELGAGTGLVGIVAARLGAKRVVVTDGDEGVCDALRDGVERNGVGNVVVVKKLLWGVGGGGEMGGEKFDLVVGADVTYDGSVIPHLVAELVQQFEKNPSTKVLISATIRNEDTFAVFRECCAKSDLSLSETTWTPPTPPIFYYPTSTPIRITHVTRG